MVARVRVDPARAAKAREVIARLSAVFPGATTELAYRNPFELLVATILSAQSTDRRVNEVTPALFARHPDAQALASADIPALEAAIKPTGFFRMKAKALVGMAAALVERHGGGVPPTMEALVELPGVGRKTANVVLGHALGVPGLPVDRHVFRVATRIGIARGNTPEIVEQELCALLPPEQWTLASDCLILHGRRVCRPAPLCDKCVVRDLCAYYRNVIVRTASRRVPAGQAAARATRDESHGPGSRRPPRATARRRR